MKNKIIIVLSILCIVFSGCNQNIGMKNPASVLCIEKGGNLDLESGICSFENGFKCEEWDLFRGECEINSFEECKFLTGIILESYPIKCVYNNKTFAEEISNKNKCEIMNGKYIESSNECEMIDKNSCDILNGQFNECGSACRNNPDAEICTLQCVPFCKIDNFCGGIGGIECENGYQCQLDGDYPDAGGKCIEPKICTKEYAPVCGIDGITYSNKCMAGNIEIDHFGKCFNKEDKLECENKNGNYGQFGMMQMYQCNLPTSDGGKSCNDSDEEYNEDLNKYKEN